jgi:hypothetical protein
VGLRDYLDKVRYGDIKLPGITRIPAEHVLVPGFQSAPFEAGRHYFTIRADSVSLRHDRDWFTTWQPMLVAVTEFRYGTREVSVPFVIGPDTLRQRVNAEVPLATVYSATRLAGTHPYIGGRLTVTVLLFRVKHDDYLKKLLGVVDKLAGALDFATMLSPYLKVAETVIDGIDSVLGDKSTVAVLGHRTEYDPNAGDIFRPGYFAVTRSGALDPAGLWVGEDHLLRSGTEAASAQPVSDDLVLYSITGTDTRNDVPSLPWFAPLWERVDTAAGTGTDDGKTAMKVHLAVLYEQLRRSPDVARGQARELYLENETLARRLFDDALTTRSYAKSPGSANGGGDELQREFLDLLGSDW